MLELRLEELSALIAESNPKVVAIQLPAGLRPYASQFSDTLESKGYEVVFAGDPCYGACDIADEDMAHAGVDILIHCGHSKMMPTTSIPVIYWEVHDSIGLVDAVKKNMEKFRGLGSKVGIVTTVQHVEKINSVIEYLNDEGFIAKAGLPGSRVSYPGQVLGCSFETAHDVDADFYIFIGTGRFHPLGISFATGKPVVACEPYTQECEVINAYESVLYRKRYAMIAKATDCRRFGIVVSTKRGQYRLEDAKIIKKLLNSHGKSCQLVFTSEVSKELIRDFDFDAYVIAACPRIAIDDAVSFEKPVLTIAEARIMIEGGQYLFDEIDNL